MNKQHTSSAMPYAFSAPAIIGLTLFIALPFLVAVVFAFTDLRLGSPLPVEFVGLRQFESIVADESFGRAVLNNVIFALVVTPAQTGLALALALLLNRKLAAAAWFRTFFFLPVVFPMSLVAVIWILIYAPGPNGMMNALLHVLTFGLWTPHNFLHDSTLAMPAIMLTSIWQGAGFQMVILLAALQSIPMTLYEAAAIEGAGPWSRFVHVTLPGLRNALIFVVLLTMILAFRLFDQVQIMTRGGPQDATTTVMYEMVQSVFTRGRVARASAMTVVLFVIVIAFTWLQRRFAPQLREGE